MAREQPPGHVVTGHVVTGHVVPGRAPVREALRAGRRLHELVLSAPAGAVAELVAAAQAAGVVVRRAAAAELDGLAGGVRHQGVVAVAPPFPYQPLAVVADADLVVVLDGVTDPRNLGAVARAAEQAGAAGLVLRTRRSAQVTASAEKASAGALSWLPVVRVTNIVRALGDLAAAGFWVVGLDGDAPRSLWDEPLLDGRVALVLGAEDTGLSRLVSERVDGRVAIPTQGRLGSLNVATAAAVALFEVRRRRRAAG